MDTGPAHLAAAVNCPTISIFTRGCPYWYYPYTQKGIAVYIKKYVSETSRRVKPEALAKAPESFNLITPNCVVKAVNKTLSTKPNKKIQFNGLTCD
jgi:ADP-heptose:LPS heptosyltransferase